MEVNKRWLGIFAVGAVVAVLAIRAPSEDVAKQTAMATKVARPNVRQADAQLELEKLQPRQFREKTSQDLFKSKSWYVPPPPPKPVKLAPPPPPPPPPPPTAPPLPYSFMGSYQEPGGKLVIYLTKAGRVLAVSPGETLENTYLVDGMTGGYFSMTYIPLNIKQTLRTR